MGVGDVLQRLPVALPFDLLLVRLHSGRDHVLKQFLVLLASGEHGHTEAFVRGVTHGSTSLGARSLDVHVPVVHLHEAISKHTVVLKEKDKHHMRRQCGGCVKV